MTFIAIIGDIKDSKELENRREVQQKLNCVLKNVNKIFAEDISANFIITLGDEFQGLLSGCGHILDIIKYIQRELYPVRLRFGVGFGKIHTAIFRDAAIGADGPAYYAARKMIEELREQEKRLKKQAADIQISIYGTEKFEVTEINTMLVLMKLMEDGWSEKQRYTIWDMEQNGGSQEECAKRMRTTQSTVARRLAEGNYVVYVRVRKVVKEAIRRLGEIQNDK